MIGEQLTWSTRTVLQRNQGGFTYLWLLLYVAISSASVATLSCMWQTQVQRSNEEELVFRLQQFAAALDSYAQASPIGVNCLPMSLDELLEDRRLGVTKRHLRNLYQNPFTGKWDWVVKRDTGGFITGIHTDRPLVLITRSAERETVAVGKITKCPNSNAASKS